MIIVTAGHVDHGKTALVKALTGCDTDRLPEEKQRGMSIDLGFAWLPAQDGSRLAFIDVPGHEKFLRNMIAGVTGVDLGLLVIAADDGPMPQTVEHLQVLSLLGVERLLVALTKTDLADAARLAAAQEEIAGLLAASRFAGAPVFQVCSRNGAGIEDLRAALLDCRFHDESDAATGLLRMNIDRAFSLKGAGLVVTGTIVSGTVAVGDEVVLAPGNRPARVRSVHANGIDGASAMRGQRCALNLAGAGVEPGSIERGHQVLAPGLYPASTLVDVRLELLASLAPMRKWPVSITAFIGTTAAQGMLSLLDEAGSRAGTVLARCSFTAPLLAFAGDRMLLRHAGSAQLLGMGMVLDPLPPPRTRKDACRLRLLEAIAPADAGKTLAQLLALDAPLDCDWLARAFQLGPAQLNKVLHSCPVPFIHLPEPNTQLVMARASWDALQEQSLASIAALHQEQPESPGITLKEWQRQFQAPGAGSRHGGLLGGLLGGHSAAVLAGALLDTLLGAQRLARQRQYFHLPGHKPRLRPEDDALLRRLSPLLEQAGVRAPRVVELVDSLGIERPLLEAALQRMALAGCLLRVARNRFYLPAELRQLAAVCERLAQQDESGCFSAAAYRDASGLGRNLTIEVLEFFDNAGLTRRQGEVRAMLADASIFADADPINGRDTLPVERTGFKPAGGCQTPLGSSTLSSSANNVSDPTNGEEESDAPAGIARESRRVAPAGATAACRM